MKKTMLLLAIMLLLFVSSVMAFQPINYKERCEIIRPATEYRAEKSFGMIGIWGRLSNGELICFTPGNNPTLAQTVEEQTGVSPPDEPEEPPVCELKKVCEMVRVQKCLSYPPYSCYYTYKKVCEWKEVCE